MMGLWLPRGPCVAAVVLMLMVLSRPVALVRDPQSRFLLQLKAECHYLNGRERVRSVTRFIYNQEEFARFDSDVGKFLAVTELGRPIAEDLNSQKDVLDNYRASVDRCRNNYALVEWFLLELKGSSFKINAPQRLVCEGLSQDQAPVTVSPRPWLGLKCQLRKGHSHTMTAILISAEPQVTVYPTKTRPLDHHNLLVCSVSGFYPGHIEVRWFRNGQEEKTGVVSTGLIRNGDWTFQILVMLETVPQSGEVYTCQVEHPSLTSPATVKWRAQSTSARSKTLSGVVVGVLGLLSLAGGLFICFRNRQDS